MSSEQITQETVPVETTTTETVTPPTATPTPVAKADTPAPQTSWKDSISEEYRADPNIEKFTEIDALAKSYINATKMIGKIKLLYQIIILQTINGMKSMQNLADQNLQINIS